MKKWKIGNIYLEYLQYFTSINGNLLLQTLFLLRNLSRWVSNRNSEIFWKTKLYVIVDNFCINWKDMEIKCELQIFHARNFQVQYLDEMINIVKFDGKPVVWWENIKTFLPFSSHLITIIFRDASVFREDFLARDRFCCCDKHWY